MPPRGVKNGTKRARQYEKVKSGARRRGASTSRAKEMAARTVNKNRARSGESRTRSRSSTSGSSPQRRGGQRSGTSGPKGQTKEQLYNQAKRLRIDGRFEHGQEPVATSRRGEEKPLIRRFRYPGEG
jgi:hypothetical protein